MILTRTLLAAPVWNAIVLARGIIEGWNQFKQAERGALRKESHR
jgi:hypothetical protein